MSDDNGHRPKYHEADARRFLDDRGTSAAAAPNGLNPATIMEKAVRERIVDSYFWKEQCFGVNEADIVDRVVDHVRCIGGTTGTAQKPTPFLCLAFKLLQLAPDDDILDAYLKHGGDKFKYLRVLTLFYIRLTRPAAAVYQTLEPYLADRRKIRRKGRDGTTLTFVDEFVDDLLVKSRVCATSLWKLPHRDDLEDIGKLEPRESALGDIDAILEEEEEGGEEDEDKDADEKNEDGSGSEDNRPGSGHKDGESDEDKRYAHKRQRSNSNSSDDRSRERRRRTPESDDDSR